MGTKENGGMSNSIVGANLTTDGILTMTGLTADTGYVDLKAT